MKTIRFSGFLFVVMMAGCLNLLSQTEGCSEFCSSSCIHKANIGATIDELNQRVADNENSVLAYDQRGMYYIQKGEYELAISDFKKALQIDPLNSEIHNHLGIVYFIVGNYELALQCYDNSISSDPEYAKAYFNRGILMIKINNEEAAYKDLLKASKLKHQPAREFLSENYDSQRPFGI